MKTEAVRSVAALATFPRSINLSLTNKRTVKLFNERSNLHHLSATNQPPGYPRGILSRIADGSMTVHVHTRPRAPQQHPRVPRVLLLKARYRLLNLISNILRCYAGYSARGVSLKVNIPMY